MKAKQFQYRNKDIPMLKKEITARMLYAVLFSLIFFVQSTVFFVNIDFNFSILAKSIILTTMILSLLLAGVSFIFAMRAMSHINTIKRHGSSVATITLIFSSTKKGFLNLYRIILSIISFVISMLLIAVITYSILEIIYLGTLSEYLPALLLTAAASYNSLFHVKQEIKIMQTVNPFIRPF